MKNKEEITKKAFHQCYQLIVWKFWDYCVPQILREINSGESRSLNTGLFCIFWGSEFC